MSLKTPRPLIYLDTAILINLAEERECATAIRNVFNTIFRNEQFTLIFSFAYLEDLMDADQRSARQIARFMDDLRKMGQVRWIRSIEYIRKEEVKVAFFRFLGIPYIKEDIFSLNVADSLSRNIASDIRNNMGMCGIEEIVEIMLQDTKKRPGFLNYRNYRCNFPSVMQKARLFRGRKKEFSSNEKREWIQDYLGPQLMTPNGIVLETSGYLLDFVNSIRDMQIEMPDLFLTIAFYEGKLKGSGSDKPSDIEDMSHLVGIINCSTAFADKTVVDALQRGRIQPLPRKNGEFEDWLKELNQDAPRISCGINQ